MNAIPNITSATVKVMRSHDYCHFEVSLGTAEDVVEILTPERVDELRKTAARLADKAVEQYKTAKAWASRVTFNSGERLERLEKLAEIIRTTPEHERTPEETAIIKGIADERYAARRYDYQDDWDYPAR